MLFWHNRDSSLCDVLPLFICTWKKLGRNNDFDYLIMIEIYVLHPTFGCEELATMNIATLKILNFFLKLRRECLIGRNPIIGDKNIKKTPITNYYIFTRHVSALHF